MEGTQVLGLLAALALVAAQDPPPPPAAAPEPFVYDTWLAWNSFEAGAWVEHEVRTTTGRTEGDRLKLRRRIEAKGALTVTLAFERLVNGAAGEPGRETVAKPPKEPRPVGRAECPKCQKVHPSDVEQGVRKVKVGTAELECVYVAGSVTDCEGRKQGTLMRWFHKDVPGWLVRQETLVEDRRTVTQCTGYGTR